jgi:hypothetical protein
MVAMLPVPRSGLLIRHTWITAIDGHIGRLQVKQRRDQHMRRL